MHFPQSENLNVIFSDYGDVHQIKLLLIHTDFPVFLGIRIRLLRSLLSPLSDFTTRKIK